MTHHRFASSGLSRASLTLCLASALWLPTAARANDGAMGGMGANLVPLNESRVRMVAEDIAMLAVQDKGGFDSWKVTAKYDFENASDEAVKLQIGFPEHRCDDGGESDCIAGGRFVGLETFVRGKPVKHRKGTIDRQHDWAPSYGVVWVYDVSFAPREKLVIEHRYSMPAGASVGGMLDGSYVTQTGSLWNGPIGHARISVLFDGVLSGFAHYGDLPMVSYTEILRGEASRTTVVFEATSWMPKEPTQVYSFWRYGDQLKQKDAECNALWEIYSHHAIGEPGIEQLRAAWYAKSPETLRICRNMVLARHGRRFKDEALNRIFYGEQGWVAGSAPFVPFEPNPDFRQRMLSIEDRQVMAFVREAEAHLKQVQAGSPQATADTEALPGAVDPARSGTTPAPDGKSDKSKPTPAVEERGSSAGGCGCQVGSTGAPSSWALWLWGGLVLLLLRGLGARAGWTGVGG